ncbi:META domain-containing protein [Cognataquiflexum rubidum]|uniref:META domain-containing protein n=1 Tax=Cognataquiflexum rubidum TaxID=2922273 RepID=UPI001F13B000|nr:META domain-containing protein [Cognataquiflexum rubidum]MCH6233924.1 META domain-containing protein [Cognataquiflexum rubidum]
MKKLSGILILTFFLGFSSCSSVGNLNPLSLLTGNNWVLNSMLGKALDPAKFAGGLPFLNFQEGGKLAGFAGCNNFNGSFNLEGTSLKLDPGAMTRKACEGDGEKDFTSALSQVANFKVNKNKLTLLDGAAKELMSFISQTKP